MDARKNMDSSEHHLYGKWVLWAHLPHDTDWTIRSYKRIMDIKRGRRNDKIKPSTS